MQAECLLSGRRTDESNFRFWPGAAVREPASDGCEQPAATRAAIGRGGGR
jgi:hypothetical protein